MKKHFIVFFALCLFAFACEQESITPEWTDQNYELAERGMRCDLTQIPLYIPAPQFVQGEAINFNNKFAVTRSADYEAVNEANINIEQIEYDVNGSPSESQITFERNNNYELSIYVRYAVNGVFQQETFSLCFRVEGEKLRWGCTDYCEEVSDSRGGIASLILP